MSFTHKQQFERCFRPHHDNVPAEGQGRMVGDTGGSTRHIPLPPSTHAHHRVTGAYLGTVSKLVDRRGRRLPWYNYVSAEFYMIEDGPWMRAERPSDVVLSWGLCPSIVN